MKGVVKKNILVTGPRGFLARHVLDLIDRKLYNVYSLDKAPSSTEANIFSSIDEIISSQISINVVIHLASYIPYGQFDAPSKLFYDSNIKLTGDLIKAFPDSRFVFASSVAVYGHPMSEKIRLDTPYNNPNLYGLSKLAAESIVLNHPDYGIIRFSSIIGAKMKPQTFVPILISHARTNGRIRLLGDGSRRQNYIDVRDAAALLIKVAEEPKNFIILGVAQRSYSNLEIAELISKYTGAELTFEGEDASPSFVYETEMPKMQAGFIPVYSIENTISEMI